MTASQARINTPSASPLNPDQFVDPTNWANEISYGGRRPSDDSQWLKEDNLSAGNLSALEDPEPAAGLPRPATLQGLMPRPPTPGFQAQMTPGTLRAAAAASASAGAGGAPTNPNAPPEGGAGGKKGAMVGAVVALFTAAAFAVAWFAHWIPHH